MAVTVKYKDSAFSFEEGQTLKLKCIGDKLSDNLVIETQEPLFQDCNGTHVYTVASLPRIEGKIGSIYKINLPYECIDIITRDENNHTRQVSLIETNLAQWIETNFITARELPESPVESTSTLKYYYYFPSDSSVTPNTLRIYSGGVWTTLYEGMSEVYSATAADVSGGQVYAVLWRRTYSYLCTASGSGFTDILDKDDDGVVRYSQLYSGTQQFISARTKPTTLIQASNFANNIRYWYYIEDEDDIFYYDSPEATDSPGWKSISTLKENHYYRGGIITSNEMIRDGFYRMGDTSATYEPINPAMREKVITTNGVKDVSGLQYVRVSIKTADRDDGEITENGVIDVADMRSVYVNVRDQSDTAVAQNITSASEMDSILNTSSIDDNGKIYKYVNTEETSKYTNNDYYLLEVVE